ncbi:MAG: 23S rRNA (adenine(2503)-C(2))-methyltransferase RlmN [Calditrichaeota bacterium]|nr:23S rRNA (adenine(2503)-C(2))-methyltransferase RlmN [Calditrichota bacterium]
MNKTNLTGMTLEEMEDFMASIGQPAFRARQLFNWLYKRRISDVDEITVFSKKFRDELKEKVEMGHVEIADRQISADGETNKFLFRLRDGHFIESVFMVDGKRRTVCLSSQVGCALGCSFCATGRMGFQRNLSVGEIVDQLLAVLKTMDIDATNLVFMGMGEPFLNYENVIKAATLIGHSDGIAVGKRKITISTAGLVPQIKRFADENQGFKLAISLNASDDLSRSELMPINKKYPLRQLIEAAKYYSERSRHLFTFEYLMIAGVNDRKEDVENLKKLLRGLRCKVNIIPYNPTDDRWQAPTEEAIQYFLRELLPLRIIVSVRRSKGVDIDAACGQLYHSHQEQAAK